MLSVLVLCENLRWMVPTTFMLGVAPAYISVWGAWRLLSAFLPRWVYVKGDDFLFSTYHRNLLFFFEILNGVELVFYGDLEAIEKSANGENCLYMSNHQCTVDWVLASCISYRRGCLGRTRYVLKDGLRFLPFYGFYLKMHGSLFVKRAGKYSKDKAIKQLSRDAEDHKPMWLVVFPEGTRFNPELPESIKASRDFAQSQSLQPFDSVLFPRTRAVEVCLEQLRGNINSVYNVTLAYSNTYSWESKQRQAAPSMQEFLKGKSSKTHVHIERIPISDVPTDVEELKKWMYIKFQEKNRLLSNFYAGDMEDDAKFPGKCSTKPLPIWSLLPSVLLWSGSFAVVNIFKESRSLYWKVGLGTGFAGLVWMSIRD